jgi:hypothetical protein
VGQPLRDIDPQRPSGPIPGGFCIFKSGGFASRSDTLKSPDIAPIFHIAQVFHFARLHGSKIARNLGSETRFHIGERMARTRTVVTEELPEDEARRLTELETDQDATFSEILSELNAAPEDAVYSGTVHEVPVRPDGTAMKGTKEIFLFDIDQSQFGGLNEYLRDNCGTGTYRVRVKRNGVLVKNTTLRVKRIGVPAVSSQANDNMIMDRLLTRIESLEQRLIQPPGTPPDRIAEMKNMAELMVLLRPPPVPIPEPKNTMQETLALVTAILSISKEIGGDGGGGGTMWDALGKIAPGLMENAAKMLPPQQPQAQPAPQQIEHREVSPPSQRPGNGNGNPNHDAIVAEINGGAEMFGIPPAMFARLRESVLLLCRRARAGSDPRGYVDFILDEIDDIGAALQLPVSLAETLLAQADLDVKMKSAFPMTVPFDEWFSELLKLCREAIEHDNHGAADGDSREPTGQHPGNAQDHAAFDT